MAHGVKYRCEFKDYYNTAVKVDISQDGYASTVTDAQASLQPLTIEWPSDRANIFNPVRGAIATLNIEATSDNQFSEFFDSYETEYKMEVYHDGALYWTGWVMPGDFQEPFDNAPYTTTFKAYDLGYLQNISFDRSLISEYVLAFIIRSCLNNSGFNIDFKERVNIYEDSTASTAATSMLGLIEVKSGLFVDESWEGSAYDALAKILTAFNSFVIQENGVWNIVRVPDMKYTHNYRVLNYSTGVTSSSGSEDSTVSLTSHYIASRTGLYMSCPTWKKLKFKQDFGVKSLVINPDFVPTDEPATSIWSVSGSGNGTWGFASDSGAYGGADSVLYFNYNSISTLLRHDKSYTVDTSTDFYLKIRWRFKINCTGGTGLNSSQAQVRINDGGGSILYASLNDGTWVSSGYDLSNLESSEWIEGEITTDVFPQSGTLGIFLGEAIYKTGSSNKSTYWDYFEVIPISDSLDLGYKDYSEELNVGNLNDSDDITVYLGDSENGDNGAALLHGTLQVASGSATTDSWQSINGSRPDKLSQLCADCYKAQYEASTKRIQGTVIGQLDYLDVLIDNSKYYLASSMTRDFKNSTLQGEWIEIKMGWGADMVGTFTNSAGRPYDTFSTSAGQFSIVKSQTTFEASVDLGSTPVTIGTRYKLTINITDNGTSAIPEFNFAGNNKDDFTLGVNTWEVLATSTKTLHSQFATHQTITDTCDLTITVTIQEAYGI